jgi:small nuclear ribonucleoprotein (snRNP)-like protein
LSCKESKAKHLYLKRKAVKLNVAAAAEGAASAMQSVFDAVKPGPLGLLKKWHSSESKVKVVTRHCSGVRGTAVGTIAAYDRFMNLVLKDVSETYTVLVKVPRVQGRSSAADQEGAGAAGGAGELAPSSEPGDLVEPKGKVRWCRKQELRKRTLHQVFLKGDNIVLISCAADAPAHVQRAAP